jgi:hypothetical protein
MTMSKRVRILVLAAMISALCLELGERFSIPGMYGFVSIAEAVVGRPLTPVSVAGVARRTARRCAVGVYNC